MTEVRKSFLVATFDAGGTIAPTMTVVRKLVDRGHRVRVLCDLSAQGEVEAAGGIFMSWTRAPSKAGRGRAHDTFHDWQADSPAEGVQMLLDSLLIGAAEAYAQDTIDELRREPADLVIASDFLFGAQAGCESLGQPFALMTANISLVPVAGIPPLGPGLPPAQTDDERALHAEISLGVHALFDTGLPRLNALRARLGLKPLAHVADQHLAAEKTLLGTARAFDFAPDTLPAHIEYVGPQLGDPAWAKPWVAPFAANANRTKVLVGFSSTFQNHAGSLQAVIDAMDGLPIDAVITLGGVIEAHELRAPANVALVDSAPHVPAMAWADIVVTHGGHGTVMKALAAHKPMLIVPHGRDQDDNAIRVTLRGAGLSVPHTAGAEAMRTALARLLAEPALKEAAARLGARVAEEARESPVADVLEALAARPTRSLRAA